MLVIFYYSLCQAVVEPADGVDMVYLRSCSASLDYDSVPAHVTLPAIFLDFVARLVKANIPDLDFAHPFTCSCSGFLRLLNTLALQTVVKTI
eukprot:scaffold6914_cov155-Skeletonema_marinoi.AAC.2